MDRIGSGGRGRDGVERERREEEEDIFASLCFLVLCLFYGTLFLVNG